MDDTYQFSEGEYYSEEEEIEASTDQAVRDQFWALLDEIAQLYRLADLARDDEWLTDGFEEKAMTILPDIDYSREAMWQAAMDGMRAAFDTTLLESN